MFGIGKVGIAGCEAGLPGLPGRSALKSALMARLFTGWVVLHSGACTDNIPNVRDGEESPDAGVAVDAHGLDAGDISSNQHNDGSAGGEWDASRLDASVELDAGTGVDARGPDADSGHSGLDASVGADAAQQSDGSAGGEWDASRLDASMELDAGTGADARGPDADSGHSGLDASVGADATPHELDASRSMDGDAAVFADSGFDAGQSNVVLFVRRSGPGAARGRITSAPPGIDCGEVCTGYFERNATVTIMAETDESAIFGGFSGAGCGAATNCTLTLENNIEVEAYFGLRQNMAFVTSTRHAAAELGGTLGGDAICNERALAAGLPGTYVAWLSTSATNAYDRLQDARGWIRVDGLPVIDSVADIVSGRFLYPITVDEMGAAVDDALVVTGTDGAGYAYIEAAFGTCTDWTGAGRAVGGRTSAESLYWTFGSDVDCTTPAHLYCFGIDYSSPQAAPPSNELGRTAFVTAGTFAIGEGFVGADALCRAEALAAGVAGTYKALLAGIGSSAASRFSNLDLTTQVVRTDGVVVTPTTGNLLTGGPMLSPIDVAADGTTRSRGEGAWTGASTPSSPGTAETTCFNWTTMGGTGTYGAPSFANARFFSYNGELLECPRLPAHVLCLQE